MAGSPNDRLISWKEIAAYLGIDARSAMRWENERGLPVHRVPGGKRSAVFAFRGEIDAWLSSRPRVTESPQAAPPPAPAARIHPMAWTAIGAAVAIIAVLAVLFGTSRVRGSNRSASHYAFVGERLVAIDASGRHIWEREFPGLITKPGAGAWRLGAERIRKVDLDGDGRLEILVVTHAIKDPVNGQSIISSELQCFDLDGRLKWTFRPQYTAEFARSEFAPPWVIYDFTVARDARGPAVWALVNHHLWWPAFLIRLDAQGRDSVQYVSSGQLASIGFFDDGGLRRILIGGYNNEYRAGSLAVLDPDAPPAISPQSKSSEYHCADAACPTAALSQFFVFPRSELSDIVGQPTNPAVAIRLAEKQVQVDTYEAGKDTEHRSIYTFSRTPELTLLDQLFNDGYWQLHRHFESAGKIRHTDTACPARVRPTPVRLWSRSSGWQTLNSTGKSAALARKSPAS